MAGARERLVAQAIAEELRAVMARRQIKNVALSKASGIPNSTLDVLLKGTGAMDVDQLARICRALELDPGTVLSAALAKVDFGADPGTTGSVQQDRLLDAINEPKKQRKVVRKSRNAGDSPE